MNTLDELALKVAKEMPDGFLWFDGCGWEAGILEKEVVAFARRLVAELAKQEPVAYVRYEVGVLPTFVPVIAGTCEVSQPKLYEFNPLYAAPVIPAGWLTEERAEHINALCEAAAPKGEWK